MKKIFLLAIIFLSAIVSTASANSMPREEMCVGEIGRGCMLGYVKEIYGEPKERRIFDGVDEHGITWIYSPYFSVTARTNDFQQPEENFIVVGFTLKNNSLSTPSGLTVGMSYHDVVKRWGRGELYEFEGRRGYFYVPNNADVPMTLTFYVDGDTITEIELSGDW